MSTRNGFKRELEISDEEEEEEDDIDDHRSEHNYSAKRKRPNFYIQDEENDQNENDELSQLDARSMIVNLDSSAATGAHHQHNHEYINSPIF